MELGLLFNQVVNPLTTVFKVAFQGICTFGVLIYKIEPHFELSGFIYVVKQRGDMLELRTLSGSCTKMEEGDTNEFDFAL